MKRGGFTLVEVMLSIVIIGLISSYLYGTLGQIQLSNSLLADRDRKLKEREEFLSLLHKDILQSNLTSISNSQKGDNHILNLRSKNSLYSSHYVYIKWFLHEELKTVIRAESTKDFQMPVRDERLHWVQFDEVTENIEVFKLFMSNKKDGLLLYTKDLNGTESIFEFLKSE